MEYDLKSVKMPYLVGRGLRLFVFLLESPLAAVLIPSLFKSAGIRWLRQQRFDEPPTMHPIHYPAVATPGLATIKQEQSPTPVKDTASGFKFTTVWDYGQAYDNGRISPEQVAEKLLLAVQKSDQGERPLHALVSLVPEELWRQARASAQRIKNGSRLSALDGVPIAIKDELDMLPYPTKVGTSFLGTAPCQEDATVVARLRAAGALLFAKAAMHEIGIGVTGLNTVSGTPRNPYHLDHHTGGSSSGSAAAVASGLCPIAIGADGGGSIRIPASFCGLVGLKATFGRLSEFGAAPLCWSLAHVGPLAGTVADATLAYSVMAGPDPKDPLSLQQPLPDWSNWQQTELSDLTIGVYWPWFRHAEAETVQACEAMLQRFQKLNGKIVEISITDLEAARISHSITIISEMAQALDRTYQLHHREHGLDVRANLVLARKLSSRDYLQAQQVRTRMLHHFTAAFKKVDVILTPTTGIPAPAINPKALTSGESDISKLVEIMRFVTPANLTGLPAISFPIGYTAKGLPIGMQAIGRPWQETTLLRMAAAAEQNLQRCEPQLYHRLLD